MKRALLFALSLIPAFCLAEKQTELSEESQKQLADLVSANDYLAVVEINQGTLINIGEFCRVHDKVKVVANLKGNLRTSALFSSVNADINAFVPPRRIKPMPILIAGSYLVIVNSHEIANSKVGKPKPSFNYFIQHYEWAHCAWAVDSMEANYLRKLAKNFIQGD
tara:strand:+ start:19 stop:513 length:495 start_codon:yes stop_codon:yes gene_type:complete